MPGWNENSPELDAHLAEAQRLAAEHALARRRLTLDEIKAWHRATMKGLDIDDAAALDIAAEDMVGEFRGPPRLTGIGVRIGAYYGTPSKGVAAQTRRFIGTLQKLLRALDQRHPRDRLDDVDTDGMRIVAEAAAWAHAEWVRIHPFTDGNDRTSRLMANAILVRYGLPPVFALRPRPVGDYEEAASAAMDGDHWPMASYVISELVARAKR